MLGDSPYCSVAPHIVGWHAQIWAWYPRIWGVTEGYGLSPNVADLEVRIKNCITIELVCYGGTCLYKQQFLHNGNMMTQICGTRKGEDEILAKLNNITSCPMFTGVKSAMAKTTLIILLIYIWHAYFAINNRTVRC